MAFQVSFILCIQFLALITEGSRIGPVSTAMQNLAYNTANVNNEFSLLLNRNVARTSDSIIGNIEVIQTAAMNQLSAPIFETSQLLESGRCPQPWSMEDLMIRVNMELGDCTETLNDILESFRLETSLLSEKVINSVDEIVNLPSECQSYDTSSLNSDFVNYIDCFVNRITDMNHNISLDMKLARTTLINTRHQIRESIMNAEICSQNVVHDITQFLYEATANCL